MSDTLSQEEIDALREAVRSGDAFTEPEQPQVAAVEPDEESQVKVYAYDFRKPQIITPEQLHSLQIMHEVSCTSMQASLTSAFKTSVEMKLVAIDQITYGEYVLSTSNPTYLNLLAVKPGAGEAAMEVSLSIVYALIDILLGGKGTSSKEAVEPTALERNIFRNVVDMILASLSTAWSGLTKISLEIIGQESNPEYLKLAKGETSCLNITFDIHVGATTGVVTLCYPFMMIQKVLQRATEEASAKGGLVGMDGHKGGEAIFNAMNDVPLNLRSVLGSATISAEVLGSLKPGDVVTLNRRLDEPVDLYICNNLAFAADIGQRRGKVAVSLLRNNSGLHLEAEGKGAQA